MAKYHIEPVRQPLSVGTGSRRRLEERLGLRFPRALAFVARALLRLSPRSRLRRAILRRVAESAFASANRGDHEATFMLYSPDVEAVFPPELPTVGREGGTRGIQERLAFQRTWMAEWGGFEFHPDELVDFGDGRLLMIGRVRGSGLSSGAGFDNEWTGLFTMSRGKVTREQVWFSHEEALRATGLAG